MRSAGDGFDDLLEDWTQLTRGSGRAFTDACWTKSYLEALLPERVPRIELHLLRRRGRPAALLTMQQSSWPCRVWQLPRIGQLPPCRPALDEEAPGLGAEILKHLLARSDGLTLEGLHPEGPLAQRLLRAAGELGLRADLEPEPGEVVVPLDRPRPELKLGLPVTLLRQEPEQTRRLERGGYLRFQVLQDSGPELGGVLDECAALENVKWSSQGRAAGLEELRFYRQLARRAAPAGSFRLYLLRLHRHVIAFEYCLRDRQHLYHLWSGHDPAHGAEAPREVLRMRLFEHEVNRGFRGDARLGPTGPAAEPWATAVEPRCRLLVPGRSLIARGNHLASRICTMMRQTTRRYVPAALTWRKRGGVRVDDGEERLATPRDWLAD